MTDRAEYDAAYFTLLRAIEERDALMRYREYLVTEREELDRFADGIGERSELVAPKVRRPVERTARPLLEAVGRRRSVVLDELRRIDDRLSAAEDFVAECEEEVTALRR